MFTSDELLVITINPKAKKNIRAITSLLRILYKIGSVRIM